MMLGYDDAETDEDLIRHLKQKFSIDFDNRVWLHAQSENLWANLLVADGDSVQASLLAPPIETIEGKKEELLYTVVQILNVIAVADDSGIGPNEEDATFAARFSGEGAASNGVAATRHVRVGNLPSVTSDGLCWAKSFSDISHQVIEVSRFITCLLFSDRDKDASFFDSGWVEGASLLNQSSREHFCSKLFSKRAEWCACWKEFADYDGRGAFENLSVFTRFKLNLADCNALCIVEAIRNEAFGALAPGQHNDQRALAHLLQQIYKGESVEPVEIRILSQNGSGTLGFPSTSPSNNSHKHINDNNPIENINNSDCVTEGSRAIVVETAVRLLRDARRNEGVAPNTKLEECGVQLIHSSDEEVNDIFARMTVADTYEWARQYDEACEKANAQQAETTKSIDNLVKGSSLVQKDDKLLPEEDLPDAIKTEVSIGEFISRAQRLACAAGEGKYSKHLLEYVGKGIQDFHEDLSSKRRRYSQLKEGLASKRDPFTSLRELAETFVVGDSDTASNKAAYLDAYSGDALVVSKRSSLSTCDGTAVVSAMTVGLPLGHKYLILEPEVSAAYLERNPKRRLGGANCRVVLSFASEEEFQVFCDDPHMQHGAKTIRPSAWTEIKARLKRDDSFKFLILRLPDLKSEDMTDTPEKMRLDLASGRVSQRINPGGTSVLPLAFRSTSFVPLSTSSTHNKDDERDNYAQPIECMAMALVVTCRGMIDKHSIRSFLRDVMLKPFEGEQPQLAPVSSHAVSACVSMGLSQKVFCSTIAALTTMHTVYAQLRWTPGDAAGVAMLLPDHTSSNIINKLTGLAENISPSLNVEDIKLPKIGPDSLTGRLYNHFPALFHALSSRRWTQYCAYMKDAFSNGTSIPKLNFLNAFAALRGESKVASRALQDVRHLIRLLYSNAPASVVVMLLPCHLPHLRQQLTQVLKLPVDRLVVDASNLEATLRQLAVRKHMVNDSTWGGWEVNLVKAAPTIAPVDLVRLVTSLHRPGLVSLLLFDPLVLERLSSMRCVMHSSEWVDGTPLAEKVLLTSLIPLTALRTVYFENNETSLSCLFRASEPMALHAAKEMCEVAPPEPADQFDQPPFIEHLKEFLGYEDDSNPESGSIAGKRQDLKLQGENQPSHHMRVMIVVGLNQAEIEPVIELVKKKINNVVVLDPSLYLQSGPIDWGQLLQCHTSSEEAPSVPAFGKQDPISKSPRGFVNGEYDSISSRMRNMLVVVVLDAHLLSYQRRLDICKLLLVESGTRPVRLVFAESALDPRFRTIKIQGPERSCGDVEIYPVWHYKLSRIQIGPQPPVRQPEHDPPPLSLVCAVFELLGCELGHMSTSLCPQDNTLASTISESSASIYAEDTVSSACQRATQQERSVSSHRLTSWLRSSSFSKLIKTLKSSAHVPKVVAEHAVALAVVRTHCILLAVQKDSGRDIGQVLLGMSQERSGPVPILISTATAVVVYQALRCGKSDLSSLSFGSFLRDWPLAPVSTQKVRVGAYIKMLQDSLSPQSPSTSAASSGSAADLLSQSILSQLDSANLGMANTLNPCILASCYESNGRPQSLAAYQLSSTMHGSVRHVIVDHGKLDYNTLTSVWANFSYSAEQLCDILSAGPEPVLYLLAINESAFVRIFVSFDIITKSLDERTLRVLVRQVRALSLFLQHERSFQVKHGGQPIHSSISRKLAVIKWAIFCSARGGSTQLHSAGLDFSSSDLDVVLKSLNIDLTVESLNDRNFLAMLLAFNESVKHQSLADTVSKTRLPQVVQLLHTSRTITLGYLWVVQAMKDQEPHTDNPEELFMPWARTHVLGFSQQDEVHSKVSALLPTHITFFDFTRKAQALVISKVLSSAIDASTADVGLNNLKGFVKKRKEALGLAKFMLSMYEASTSILGESGRSQLDRVLLLFEVIASADVLSAEPHREDVSNAVADRSDLRLVHLLWMFTSAPLQNGKEVESIAFEALALAQKRELAWPFNSVRESVKRTVCRLFMLAAANKASSSDDNAAQRTLDCCSFNSLEATELVEIAQHVVCSDGCFDASETRLTDEHYSALLNISTAAWGRYPMASFCPPSWIWLQINSSRDSAFYNYLKKSTFDILKNAATDTLLKDSDILNLSEFGKCVFCPGIADPFVLNEFVQTFNNTSTVSVDLVRALKDPNVVWLHRPGAQISKNSSFWQKLSDQIQSKLRLLDLAEMGLNRIDKNAKNENLKTLIKRSLVLTAGATISIVVDNLRCYTAILWRILVLRRRDTVESEIENNESDDDDSEDSSRFRKELGDELRHLLGGLWLCIGWFGSLGTMPQDLPLGNTRVTEDMTSSLQRNMEHTFAKWLELALDEACTFNLDAEHSHFILEYGLAVPNVEAQWAAAHTGSARDLFQSGLSAYMQTIGFLVGHSASAMARLTKGNRERDGWSFTRYRSVKTETERHALISDAFISLWEEAHSKKQTKMTTAPVEMTLAMGFSKAILKLLEDGTQQQLNLVGLLKWNDKLDIEFPKWLKEYLVHSPCKSKRKEDLFVYLDKCCNQKVAYWNKVSPKVRTLSELVQQAKSIVCVPVHEIRDGRLESCVLLHEFTSLATAHDKDMLSNPSSSAPIGSDRFDSTVQPASENLLECVQTRPPIGHFYGQVAPFDSADRQQVLLMSNHKLLNSGNIAIDARLLLSLEEKSYIELVGFKQISVVEGQECFLVFHRAGLVTDRRSNTSDHSFDTEEHLFNYISVMNHVNSVTPRDEVLLTFTSYRECWIFLDRTCGDRTLVVLRGCALYRRNRQSWEGIKLNSGSSSFLYAAASIDRELCTIMPSCVSHVARTVCTLKDQGGEDLRKNIAEWMRRLYDEGKSITRRDMRHAVDALHVPEPDAFVQNMVLALAHGKWLRALFSSDETLSESLLRPFFTKWASDEKSSTPIIRKMRAIGDETVEPLQSIDAVCLHPVRFNSDDSPSTPGSHFPPCFFNDDDVPDHEEVDEVDEEDEEGSDIEDGDAYDDVLDHEETDEDDEEDKEERDIHEGDDGVEYGAEEEEDVEEDGIRSHPSINQDKVEETSERTKNVADKRMIGEAKFFMENKFIFCDLFRERKDVKVNSELLPTLSVAIIFPEATLRNCKRDTDSRTAQWVLDVLSSPILVKTKHLFLYVLVYGGSTVGTDGLTVSEHDTFIAVSLADCCPDETLRKTLNNIISPLKKNDSDDIRKLLLRRDYRYGVVACSDILQRIRIHPLLDKVIHVVDVESAVHGDEALYLRIINFFDSNCHIVYVRGLNLATDIFLKWICEYTYRWPWRLVYFQGLDIRFNFAEIRDRFRVLDPTNNVVSGELGMNARSIHQLWWRKHDISSEVSTRPLLKFKVDADTGHGDAEWQNHVRADIMGSGRCVVLLTSPPGAGKTFLANKLQAEFQKTHGNVAFRFDCSDDRLVMTSLSDLLDQTFAGQTTDQKALLVADEFHLLNNRQKQELFEWFTPQLSWLRVLLIGNRILRVDNMLMEGLQTQQAHVSASERADGEKPLFTIRSEVAELTPEYVIKTCQAKELFGSNELAKILHMWFSVLLNLFGKSALSLRAAFNMCKELRDPDLHQQSRIFEEQLQSHVQSAMPLLSAMSTKVIAKTFVEWQLEFLNGLEDQEGTRSSREQRDWWKEKLNEKRLDSRPLLYNLVTAAYLASVLRLRPCKSYTEFGMTQAPQRWRPEKRAQVWITEILTKLVGHESARCVQDGDNVHEWIDQDPFPLILERGSNIIMNSGGEAAHANLHKAIGITKQFSDLAQLQHLLVHQQPINWVEVDKQWRMQPISDLDDFEQLLQDAPNRLLCLEAAAGILSSECGGASRHSVQDETGKASLQLCFLAERSAERDVMGSGLITQMICDVYELDRAILENEHPAAYGTEMQYYAIWRCLLSAGITNGKNGHILTSSQRVVQALDSQIVFSDLLTKALQWANRGSFWSVYTYRELDKHKDINTCHMRLRRVLQVVSNRIASEQWLPSEEESRRSGAEESLFLLWSGPFCKMLDSTDVSLAVRLALVSFTTRHPTKEVHGTLHEALVRICRNDPNAGGSLEKFCNNIDKNPDQFKNDLRELDRESNNNNDLASFLNAFAMVGRRATHRGLFNEAIKVVRIVLHDSTTRNSTKPETLTFFGL